MVPRVWCPAGTPGWGRRVFPKCRVPGGRVGNGNGLSERGLCRIDRRDAMLWNCFILEESMNKNDPPLIQSRLEDVGELPNRGFADPGENACDVIRLLVARSGSYGMH